MRKALAIVLAFIVAGYVVYLDYLFVQWTAWKMVRITFPDLPRYPVYTFVRYLFYLTGALIILVYFAYFIFYLYFKSGERRRLTPRFFPKVSIVVPAYNEAMNIERLIESIQYQDYPFENCEVIIVDDGSQDGTAEIAKRLGAKVIRHERNTGKAKALEDGIKAAKGEVILTMDADSYFADGSSLKNVVENLFSRRFIGISTGVVRIEERTGGLIEKLQAIEFIHSFEMGRRVQGYLDWLLVVPGAFSAFKGYFLKSLPSIPKDTLAEDFELAMIAYRAGLSSSFEPGAAVYTEPKLSWKDLYKQRVRWYYGGLQVMAKYHDMIMNPKYGERGLFLFVHMILLEYITPVLFVFGIIVLPLILILQYAFGFQILDIILPIKPMVLIFLTVYLLQYLAGVLISALAIAMERGSPTAVRYLPAIFIYYAIYNPLLSLAKVDAMMRFFRGVIQSW